MGYSQSRRIARWTVLFASPMLCPLFLLAQEVSSDEARISVSAERFSTEQLSIYHEVLKDWADDGRSPVHLSEKTIPLEKEAADCAKGIRMEKSDPAKVHRFQPEDLSQLGSGKIHLVDPDEQSKDVKKNDPGIAIRNGRSVDEAVANGFAHGLVTLSEIQFNEKHDLAVVWFGFTCGGLCGNGGTVVLEKKKGVWKKRKPCSIWMS